MKSDEAVILKTDSRGRVRTPAAKREEILAEFERSGLTGVKFAKLAGIKYQTLATWLKKRRRPNPPVPPIRWLEATMAPMQGSPPDPVKLTIEFSEGVKLEISSLAQIELAAALIRTVRKPC